MKVLCLCLFLFGCSTANNLYPVEITKCYECGDVLKKENGIIASEYFKNSNLGTDVMDMIANEYVYVHDKCNRLIIGERALIVGGARHFEIIDGKLVTDFTMMDGLIMLSVLLLGIISVCIIKNIKRNRK